MAENSNQGEEYKLDLPKYLERIQFEGTPEPTLESLSLLLLHHQQNIPFSSLEGFQVNFMAIE